VAKNTIDFFKARSAASERKTLIVLKYFASWCRVMLPRVRGPRIGYIDFFAGPGVYDDGSKSTAIKVIDHALTDPRLCDKLAIWFNDKEKKFVDRLTTNIAAVPGIGDFKIPPKVTNIPMGADLVNLFKKRRDFPCFIFIDPWGYKGVTLDLILSAVANWGCDVLLFFNYSRINAAITNSAMTDNINNLFGKDVADFLRSKVRNMKPSTREILVMNEFYNAVRKHQGTYPISYKVKSEQGRTSHFLVFLSKHPLGYSIMKDVMHGESQIIIDGVADYCYNPRLPVDYTPQQPLISPLYELEEDLRDVFTGRTLSMSAIYRNHHVGTPYVEKNYKAALLNLEAQGKISANPPAEKRRMMKGKRTFGNNVMVHFKAR